VRCIPPERISACDVRRPNAADSRQKPVVITPEQLVQLRRNDAGRAGDWRWVAHYPYRARAGGRQLGVAVRIKDRHRRADLQAGARDGLVAVQRGRFYACPVRRSPLD